MSVIIGLCIVAFAPFIVKDANDEEEGGGKKEQATTWEGCVLILISQVFSATQFVFEAKLLGGYDLDPFQIVGTEGATGFIIYCCLLPILGLIPGCGPPYCSKYGYLENTRNAF